LKENNETNSVQPDFWSQRYSSGRTPWRLDYVPARLQNFIRSLPCARNVLIPGCGQDYRSIDAFHRAGHQVTAIDFSSIAVDAVKKVLPALADHIVLGDFFTYKFKSAPFDLIYERTFLCSLPPSLWKNYSARAAQLLQPGGTLAGFFFYGEEPDPPPFPLTEAKASEVFGDRFELQTNEPVSDSLPIFAGDEKWQEWRLGER
jgi:Thiopurine S-methyltransferase (TPMT)